MRPWSRLPHPPNTRSAPHATPDFYMSRSANGGTIGRANKITRRYYMHNACSRLAWRRAASSRLEEVNQASGVTSARRSRMRVHRLARYIEPRLEDAAAAGLGDEQRAVVGAAIGDIGGVVFGTGADAVYRLAA